jgi:hypothetical protein
LKWISHRKMRKRRRNQREGGKKRKKKNAILFYSKICFVSNEDTWYLLSTTCIQDLVVKNTD